LGKKFSKKPKLNILGQLGQACGTIGQVVDSWDFLEVISSIFGPNLE
jgi:hypothetical protein